MEEEIAKHKQAIVIILEVHQCILFSFMFLLKRFALDFDSITCFLVFY